MWYKKKLVELNSNKSQEPDEIHPRLLRELSSVIAEPLAKLFQNSLVQGVVPNEKVSKVLIRIIDL